MIFVAQAEMFRISHVYLYVADLPFYLPSKLALCYTHVSSLNLLNPALEAIFLKILRAVSERIMIDGK